MQPPIVDACVAGTGSLGVCRCDDSPHRLDFLLVGLTILSSRVRIR